MSKWAARTTDRLTVIFGLWVAVAVIYWPSAVALDGIWRGSAGNSYTHGYLVLAASLWLIVRDRARLAAAPVRPVGWAWILVLILSGAWLWSWRAAIQQLHVLLLPAILLAALLAALGWRVTRILLFPVGFLVFAMPVWGAINSSLQTLSAKGNGILMWLSGMPAYMQGDLIRLPGGSIEIAQACAGLNGFLIGLAVAALYGELTRDQLRRRLAWLALMGTLAFIANSIRIFIVTVAAYESDMRSSLVTHHIWLGWCLFAVAVGVFLLIAGRLADMWDRGLPQEARSREPESSEAAQLPSGQGPGVAGLAVAFACLGFLPVLAYGTDLLRSKTHGDIFIRWPEAPQGWQGPRPEVAGEWSPRFVNPSVESLRRYIDPRAEAVEVFVVAYRTQTQHGKLLGYENDLLGSATQLQLQPQSQRIVDTVAGRWREAVAVDPTGARSLIWWRYRIGDRTFSEPRLSQLWYGLAALTGRPPLSSLTALRVACDPDCAAVREQLAAAAARLQPGVKLPR
jgi:EpsI family protein